jgi:endonuclease-3 related protein
MNKFVSISVIFGRNQDLLEMTGWFPTEPTSSRWWGGVATTDEIVISALLVQQQSWRVVAKVLKKLNESSRSTLNSISELSVSEIEGLLKNLNFYKTKARRLQKIAAASTKPGGLGMMLLMENRDELLSIEGIGEETADCLLLFAGNQLVLPVSAYVRRVMERVLGEKLTTRELKSMCQDSIRRDLYSYKLFYAGLSTVGRVYCHRIADCTKCILNELCSYAAHPRIVSLKPAREVE